jgi:hypothetical protein
MNTLLEDIRRTDPGRYLTPEEYDALLRAEPYLAPRIAAAKAAEAAQQDVLTATIETIFKKYDFQTGRANYGPAKCYRDVGYVYSYCVFAMLCDDMPMLHDKLLLWLRTILQSLAFPGGTKGIDSIRATYSLLRKELNRRVPPESAALLDPFFKAAEEVLPRP